MKKSIKTAAVGAALYILLSALAFSSCIVSRGNGCPDAQRMIGYGCYRGR